MSKFGSVSAELQNVLDEVHPLLLNIDDTLSTQSRAPGKWSRKQIVCHLIDSAANNHQRFVRAAIQGELSFPGYNQNAMVELENPNVLEWNFLVEFWMHYNHFIASLLKQIDDDRWNVPCNIGDHPTDTLGAIAEDYVEHLKHHLNQIVGERFSSTYSVRS